jgi:hypothetical protein
MRDGRDLDGDGRQASETPDPDSTVVASHQANSHGTAASSTIPRYRCCSQKQHVGGPSASPSLHWI